ncbi:MAG: flavodoxin domain-containing protein, partial [Deltaproteobacteria bacterium]|nr:flavodoxin domain-containing protein [Deltaproteobacteria bacterium]
MPKALVVYASRTNQTKKIAELIAEGIRMAGCEADVVNVRDIKDEEALR